MAVGLLDVGSLVVRKLNVLTLVKPSPQGRPRSPLAHLRGWQVSLCAERSLQLPRASASAPAAAWCSHQLYLHLPGVVSVRGSITPEVPPKDHFLASH